MKKTIEATLFILFFFTCAAGFIYAAKAGVSKCKGSEDFRTCVNL